MLEQKCSWCLSDPLYEKYHDEEWGVAVHDDQKLFEMLILEGAQAGLSWFTILKRREGYRKAFFNFDVKKIDRYNKEDKAEEKKILVEKLMQNENIIRNRLKIESVFINAEKFIQVQKEYGSFANYIWGYTDGKIIKNNPKDMKDAVASSELSDAISKDLKRRGFKFVGSTIMYAYLQAVGVVDDHFEYCWRRENKKEK